MGFGEAVRTVFSRYATFSGRARRSEYWFFYLFGAIVGIVLGTVLGVTALATVDLPTGTFSSGFWVVWTLVMVVLVALIVPSIAVAVRRLHDTGRSGFWYFITFVPLAGGIILLVFLAGEGQPGTNQFGPDPKAPAAQPDPVTA